MGINCFLVCSYFLYSLHQLTQPHGQQDYRKRVPHTRGKGADIPINPSYHFNVYFQFLYKNEVDILIRIGCYCLFTELGNF